MTHQRPPSRPYVMRPRESVPERPSAEESPRDHRVPIVQPNRLSVKEVRALTRPGATNPRYRPTDRWLERWAYTHGSGGDGPFLAQLSLTPRSPSAGMVPLDDQESKLVDKVVRESKPWARMFVMLWYRSVATPQQIADILRMRRRQAIYEEREQVLAYYTGRFDGVLDLPDIAHLSP